MAVIPNSLDANGNPDGKVIVFDNNGANQVLGSASPWPQRFSVFRPEAAPLPGFTWPAGSFADYVIMIPPGFGDLFCSGHVWLPDGRLFVAGGNSRYPSAAANYFEGSTFVGIWDPQQVGSSALGWVFECSINNKPMRVKRWYPTVTMMGDDRIIVSGGVESTDPTRNPCTMDLAFNTYEVWRISLNNWEQDPLAPGQSMLYGGPAAGCGGGSVFDMYPRQHLLSSGHLFMAGQWAGANRNYHNPLLGSAQPWLPGPIFSTQSRTYGSSVLVPNVGNIPSHRDRVMIVGGNQGSASPIDLTEVIDPLATTLAWSSWPRLNHGRMLINTVLLPDGAALVLGGCSTPYYLPGGPQTPVFDPEIYRESSNSWKLQNPQVSARMYHSTAALLPSGRVVSGGSDIRTSDYEVFTPDYIACGQSRPVFAGTVPVQLQWATIYTIGHGPPSDGTSVARVVLMRPCSVTHHSDMDQRYVELKFPDDGEEPPANSVRVKTPPAPAPNGTRDSVIAPRGWYMMFLVDTTGTPSEARWVRLP